MGQHIRQLREAAGLDIADLSRKTQLSVAQLRQLEDGGDARFASAEDKAQALRRVLAVLQGDGSVDAPAQPQPEGWGAAPKNVIDDIVRLSERTTRFPDFESSFQARELAQRWGGWVAMAVVLAALVFDPWDWRPVLMGWVKGESSVPSAQTASGSADPKAPVFAIQEVITPAVVIAPALPAAEVVVPVVPTPAVPASVPAPAAQSAQSAQSAGTAVSCEGIQDAPVAVQALHRSKPGNYVYLVATHDLTLCVQDGTSKSTRLELKANAGRSVYGAAPWVVAGTELQHVHIYFQGGKVSLPTPTPRRVSLSETAH